MEAHHLPSATTTCATSGAGSFRAVAKPGVTAAQAFDAALQTTGHPDPGPRPTVTLALVTTSTVDKKLSWVVVLADASVVRISGGPAPIPGETKPPPPPCYIGSQVIPVDAISGSVLFSAAQSVPGR